MKTEKGYGRGWVLIIYAFLAYFVSSAVGSSMNAASGILAELRGWNATMLTSLISLGAVANIAAGLVFGRLAVRYSAKKLSIICCVAVSYTHLDVYKRQAIRWSLSAHPVHWRCQRRKGLAAASW